jgi:hypothetical protein
MDGDGTRVISQQAVDGSGPGPSVQARDENDRDGHDIAFRE